MFVQEVVVRVVVVDELRGVYPSWSWDNGYMVDW
jgi:hypothetical protein